VELRQLKYFIAVAEELNFGHAARKLHITQPPLSKQIKQLEQELGVPLFKRNNRKVELTYAGKTLLHHAYKIIDYINESIESTKRAYRCENNILEVGYIGIVSTTLIPFIIEELRKSDPSIELVLKEMSSIQQMEHLCNKKIDIAITHSDIESSAISKKHIYHEKFVIVLSRDHPLAHKANLTIKDLENEPFIFPENIDFLDKIIKYLRNHGLNPVISNQKSDSYFSVIPLVSGNLGISMIPESYCHFLNSNIIPRKPENPLTLPISAIYRRNDKSNLIKKFITIVDQYKETRKFAAN
jgi:DNA-binding transcriptional LysR family regulator